MTSRKIDFDLDGDLQLERSGDQFQISFSGNRLNVDGQSVLAIWRLLGDLGKFVETRSDSGLIEIAPVEISLDVKSKNIGSSSFSVGEQLSTLAKLSRFRPNLSAIALVVIRDLLRAFKGFIN